MKTLTHQITLTVFGLLSLLLFSACDDERIDLKEDTDQKNEVFNQILNDEELFAQFMDAMRGNENTMEWMRNHRGMMRNFYGRKQVTHMMRNKPEVMDSVMQGMIMFYDRDSTMKGSPEWRKKMRQHMILMMERDTLMYEQMQQHMQQKGK
ncbi:hypothetical protein [Salinimicrobium gaetbulicola]|uniref:LTXXQ motif family protein n=1 Tax=Salinimicrobium gaetbulicola TaxID=999702 RepID=A0ABW3IFG8_9FLAO